MTLKSATWRWN